MALLRQTWTLTRKNILIVLFRHSISTILRAFILPLAFMVFLAFAKNLFIPPSEYGIGSIRPVRSLQEGLRASNGGRTKLVFVNNGFTGGDIDRVIDSVSQPAIATGFNVTTVPTEDDLLTVCRSSLRGATHCYGAIVFQSSPKEGSGGVWNYTIRADGALGTKIVVGKNTNDEQIYLLPLQRAVDLAIAGVTSTSAHDALAQNVGQYPYTSLTQEERNARIRVKYQGSIIDILGVAFLIGICGITYQLTGFIASERELGMSQLLEAMMPNIKRWQPQFARLLSYHIAFDIIYLPGWICMPLVLGAAVWTNTSMGIVIIQHVLAGLALSSFSILGAAFFKKAQLSGITMVIVTLLLGLLAQVIHSASSGAVIILSLLFAPCNYMYFILLMARFERQRRGVNMVHAAPENPWPIPGIVFWVFFVIQIFVYPLLGALVERYLYGVASDGRVVVDHSLNESSETDATGATFDSIETVQLQNFTKHYYPGWLSLKTAWFTKAPKSTVVAVNDLTLTATKGQILVLLGANGSGKSTTLDAIAGLNSVTSGRITVDGAGGIGIAPQKNVLWDEVTVEEHIRIFNRLKSTTAYDDKSTIRALVKAVDLDRKVSAKAKTLSGGQKRKLQLGMMFTGGSSVCCVDEVSSGLDPLSRRKIWDILLAERGSRTIILTTHFLDEADLLADRIAILSKGTLRANGSSVELKNTLGGGYRIHIPANSDHVASPDIKGIHKYSTFSETVYVAQNSKQAAEVVRHLEDEKIKDYQVSGPTIEDVFLHLADEVRSESELDVQKSTAYASEKNNAEATTQSPDDDKRPLELLSGQKIGFTRQAWILFRKRFTVYRRNYLPNSTAFLIPVIAAGLVTLLLRGFHGVGCAPAEQVSVSDVSSFINQDNIDLVVGPTSRLSPTTIAAVFGAIFPGTTLNQSQITQFVHTVDTFDDFTNYIGNFFGDVTPAGMYLGDNINPPTLAWRGDGGIYNSILGQNLLDVLLTNITIGTQFSSFDIPWAPSTGKSLQLVVYLGLAMATYPAFFSLYPTTEMRRNVRGLQYSNGVRSLPLWLAYVSFDFVVVLAGSTIAIIILAAASSAWYHVGYLFPIFVLFGLDSILLSYVVSLFARSQLSAFAFAAAGQAIFFLIYLIAYICVVTYSPINRIDSDLLIVHFVISILTPMGSFIRTMFLALNIFSTTCSGNHLASYPGGILQYGGPLLYLIIQFFGFFGILLWYDSGSVVSWFRRFGRSKNPAPEPVLSEEDIPDSLNAPEKDGLRVQHLTKSFGKITAVENLSFEIERGSVFALLGPNGAGKSTTISLIRGDIVPSRNGGHIYIENIDINRHRASARAYLGVCPQFDAMDQLTVLEHLRFYARVRGVPDVEANVQAVVKAVGLQAFSSRMAAKLSGGNKRKLSLGIALIGNPTVLLLDEPSSGMDAAAKRVMWKTLLSVVHGRSLLLTTHSMEEADALADRAGIMARRMLAMGTIPSLRRKHGDAYYVHIAMKSAPRTTDEEIDRVKNWVLKTFPEADFEDKTYHGQMRFSILAGKVTSEIDEKSGTQEIVIEQDIGSSSSEIGSLISILEEHKDELGVEHYSVTPTNLDQVFLSIVSKHNVEEENYGAAEKKGLLQWVGLKRRSV
ncbi:hypothetical protein F5884DRAFT_856278 [Xylogone sp. PMI_703]|nr:hypothetical protein F5884DRAFT_856278 [Xylogone sp. PMI_703]